MAGCAPTPEVGRSPGTAPTFATRAGARRGDVLSHVRGSLSAPESLGHLVHEVQDVLGPPGSAAPGDLVAPNNAGVLQALQRTPRRLLRDSHRGGRPANIRHRLGDQMTHEVTVGGPGPGGHTFLHLPVHAVELPARPCPELRRAAPH